MATEYREGRQRTSVAWDHFEIKDRAKSIATCNICRDDFSYRSSVTNLMRHLRNRHGYSVVKSEDDEDNERTENGENPEQSINQQKMKTELWEYYEVRDNENKQATCSVCLEQLSFEKSLQELFEHLKTKHSIDFDKDVDKSDEEVADEDEFSLQTISEHKVRAKSSVAWDYFEVKDAQKKVASCLSCGALCSFRTSVSNLMKHARRKHGVMVEMPEDDTILESLEGVSVAEDADSKIFADTQSLSNRSHRSIVWLYFKCVDAENRLSKCLICHKTLSHSSTLTNLKKHLARKHPNVKIPAREDGRKRILLSSGGELYEVETANKFELDDDDNDNNQNETLEMDTVYLEDFDALQQEDTPKKSAKTRKRTYSSSSEEEITFVNRYKRKQSDSYDHFAKYLASLLRDLPKDAASKLQVNFLKQIMDVQKDV